MQNKDNVVPILSLDSTIFDKGGKEHKVLLDGQMAVDKTQLEQLLRNNKLLQERYDELMDDMRQNVEGLFSIMNMMGKKSGGGMLSFAAKLISKPQLMEKQLKPLEYILDKYSDHGKGN